MPGEALVESERVVIEIGIRAGRKNLQIATELGRDPSTISREIERNGGRDGYDAERAQRRADKKRKRPKSRLEADPDLGVYVADRLGLRDSPMTISIELARGVHGVVASISHECIYQAIYNKRGLDRHARRCLHLRRRRRRRRNHRNTVCDKYYSHPLGDYPTIHNRPEDANDRTEIGHLEGDLITGSYNRSALITVFDRASRNCWIQPTANKSADAVFALVALFERIPPAARKTLTWDQGSES
ncbi:MAG: IS30 family transposase [Ilumatobacteraceae bacterium]|nr:IS30 family transposase [Ilumatobacteraceae bacterium]